VGDDRSAVTLRDVRADDLPVLFEQQRDVEANTMAAFAAPDPDDRSAFDQRWQRILAHDEVIVRAIEVGGALAGSILLWRDPGLEAPEVSYWLGRDYWGRGVATEALRQFLALVPVRPLYGRVASTNPSSVRVLEKCGFRLVRTDQDVEATRGRVDEHVLRLEASTTGSPR
jgi:RimJ/RimL family protein N-acetyltransferase